MEREDEAMTESTLMLISFGCLGFVVLGTIVFVLWTRRDERNNPMPKYESPPPHIAARPRQDEPNIVDQIFRSEECDGRKWRD